MTRKAQSHDDPRIRPIRTVISGQAMQEGAGVHLTRFIGRPDLDAVDPFLLLDEFRSDNPQDYMAGFPDHPHRGFQTVTYMLAGQMRHRDNKGHSGVIGPGAVQWMHAGRGIVHSEMPEQKDGLLWGFQLWVNVPAATKMTEPSYQEYSAAEIPSIELPQNEGTVKVIAGTGPDGTAGPVRNDEVSAVYLDVSLNPGQSLTLPVPQDHIAFFYVYDGRCAAPNSGGLGYVEPGQLAVLETGRPDVRLTTPEDTGGRCIFVAGAPIGEPIARHGPFVMNTKQEILQAIEDYRNGNV